VIAVTRANWGWHRPVTPDLSDWPGLDRFLAADPRDVGCEQALEILDVYVEMVLEDAPGLAARRFPGVAVHLAVCGPCDEDFQGLLAAAGATP
jgi:hypothetical protein